MSKQILAKLVRMDHYMQEQLQLREALPLAWALNYLHALPDSEDCVGETLESTPRSHSPQSTSATLDFSLKPGKK